MLACLLLVLNAGSAHRRATVEHTTGFSPKTDTVLQYISRLCPYMHRQQKEQKANDLHLEFCTRTKLRMFYFAAVCFSHPGVLPCWQTKKEPALSGCGLNAHFLTRLY